MLVVNCAGKGNGSTQSPADGHGDVAPAVDQQSGDASGTIPVVDCPKNPDIVEGCATLGKTCTVGTACCLCEVLPACGATPTWNCVKPSEQATCGATAPAPASACSPERLRCAYCADGKPLVRECAGGKWTEQPTRICR